MASEKIDYINIKNKYSWLFDCNQKCIISPDIDGILCGLLMSHYFNWEVVGFYDGKSIALKDGVKIFDCIFLDMEIFRKNIRSIGQHMQIYNKNKIPHNWWQNLECCINPNNIRLFDANKNFSQKYPFATIHFLISILYSNNVNINLPDSAITILLYVDGTFKNLLNYPENCIDWLEYLNAKDKKHPLSKLLNVFAIQKISEIMHNLHYIFNKFKEIGNGKRGGDKIKISAINDSEYQRQINKLLEFISQLTSFQYHEEKWHFKNLNLREFNKGISTGLNNKTFNDIMQLLPVSFAITATKRIEYTQNDNLFND